METFVAVPVARAFVPTVRFGLDEDLFRSDDGFHAETPLPHSGPCHVDRGASLQGVFKMGESCFRLVPKLNIEQQSNGFGFHLEIPSMSELSMSVCSSAVSGVQHDACTLKK